MTYNTYLSLSLFANPTQSHENISLPGCDDIPLGNGNIILWYDERRERKHTLSVFKIFIR